MTGPCCHCGTDNTPCWRKGPPEKPVLCNACGARYLVKKDLTGYFPGTRKGGATAQHDAGSKPKAPRPRQAPGAGTKRKAPEALDSSYEAQARRMYEEYRVLQELSMAALFYRQAQFFVDDGVAAQTTSGTSESTSASQLTQHEDAQEECCRKSGHYLDASSDDYLEANHQEATPEVARVSAAGRVSCQPVFNRRPRKQSRPLACSC